MKHNYIKSLFAYFIVIAVFASSCQKDTDANLNNGKATISINMKGVGPSNGNKATGLRSSVGSGKSVTDPVQRQIVKFNEQFNITATLREVVPTTAPALRASTNRAETTATGEGNVLPLENGTAYTIIVYKDGTEVHTETFTQGNGDYTFELPADTYTFVAYAYGDADATGANKDPMWWTNNQMVVAGQTNSLEIVLEHKLTEVTVVFNAGAGRTISAIGAGTIAPNHNYSFNEETGVVTFGTAAAAAPLSFTGQTAGQTWTSAPTMIAIEDTDNGVVELTGINIGGIVGEISKDGWALRAGVQYILELNLGDKEEEEGILLGGKIWAPGNLVYNNGTYGFAATQFEYGDMWYWNWPTPQGVAPVPTTHRANFLTERDPCTKVAGGNWRTPSKAEVQALLNLGTSASVNHAPYQPGRVGIFLGRTTAPNNDSEPYVFFPARPTGADFFYWVNTIPSGSPDNGDAYRIGNGGYSQGWGNTDDNAPNPIRCVRD